MNFYYTIMLDGTIMVNSRWIFDNLKEAIDIFPELEKYIKLKELKRRIENGL